MFRSTEITSEIIRKKCGQIYILTDDSFTLICEYCEEEFYTLDDFRAHIKEHIPKSSVNIKIEDSISCDSVDCEPEEIENVTDSFIGILQDYVATQSSATNRTERSDSVKSHETFQSDRNDVHPLKRFHELQSNSGNESESTTELKVNLKHPTRHHKRSRKVTGKHNGVPIIVCEEIQTDDIGTDYSSDFNSIELHQYSIPGYEQQKCKKGTFGCRFCRKIFRSNRGRNDHENTHTGETPHECPICHQSFARYANFWSHSKTHSE